MPNKCQVNVRNGVNFPNKKLNSVWTTFFIGSCNNYSLNTKSQIYTQEWIKHKPWTYVVRKKSKKDAFKIKCLNILPCGDILQRHCLPSPLSINSHSLPICKNHHDTNWQQTLRFLWPIKTTTTRNFTHTYRPHIKENTSTYFLD
jgi:hypothetical protein